jgi:hypothetical protein
VRNLEAKIVKLDDGVDSAPAAVIVEGYLTAKNELDAERWRRPLRDGGHRGSLWHVSWKSGRVRLLQWRAGGLVAGGAGIGYAIGSLVKERPTLLDVLLFREPEAIPEVMIGVAAVLALASPVAEVARHFKSKKHLAHELGLEELSQLVGQVPAKSIDLIGHSLGARAVLAALQKWPECGPPIRHAVLLGGALAREPKSAWKEAASRVGGKLVNVYSKHDSVLGIAYRWQEFSPRKPAGLAPIEVEHSKLDNFDGTFYVEHHREYHKVLANAEPFGKLWAPTG